MTDPHKIVEKQLETRDSGSLQRELFSRLMPAMLHSIGEDGCITAVSDFWLAKLGYTRAEVIGAKSTDFLTPSSRRRAIEEVLPTFFRLGYCQDVEYQMVCKSGRILDVLITATLDRNTPDGRPVSLAVTTDISIQKAFERRLVESEIRYRGIVEDQTDLVSLAKPDGELLYVNQAYAMYNGMQPAELIGRRFFEFIPVAERAAVEAHVQLVMGADVSVERENQIRMPDGTLRWIAWSNRAILDAAGVVTSIHSVGRDINERKKTAQQLSDSEARYRLLADHSSDMVFRLNRQFVRVYVSPASRDVLGYDPEDLIGAKPMAMAHPDDSARVRANFEQLMSGETNYLCFTNRIQHRDGRWIWVEARVRSFVDPETGEPDGIVGALRDITEKKEVEIKLEEAVRRLEILATQDGLTQLLNRRSFDAAFERAYRNARREDAPLSLLIIDVDVFKPYNDRYGHPAGDACLKRVTEAIRSTIRRPGDVAARYGGEEFVVLLSNTNLDGAWLVAEAIRETVEALGIEHLGSRSGVVTVSIGLACTNRLMLQREPQDILLKTADVRLYAAKAMGRNRVVATDLDVG